MASRHKADRWEAEKGFHDGRVDALIHSTSWMDFVTEYELSEREGQIVGALLRLHDDESIIAQSIGVSPHTIHTYTARLYRKVGVSSRCQLLAKLLVAFIGFQSSGPSAECLR